VEAFRAAQWSDAERLAALAMPELLPRDALIALVEPTLDPDVLAALPLTGLEATSLGPWLAAVAARHLAACAGAPCLVALAVAKRLMPFAASDGAVLDLPRLEADITAWASPDPSRVGVLLPLSGPHASFGAAARRTLELAAPPGIHLDFRDTSGDAEVALTAAKALVFESRAVAILGPIGRLESAAVIRFTRAWTIPHLPLTTAVDPPDSPGPDAVLRLRTSPAELAAALARHARIEVGLTRVAILQPDQAAAREQAEAFASAFARLGGTVVRTVTFDPAQKPDERLRDLLNVTAKKAKVDFDALYLPAEVAVVKRLLPTLAQRGLVLRTSPEPTAQRPARVQLLGGLGWSTAQLIDHTDRLTDNAIFPEPFVPDAEAPATQAFIARFVALHKDRPTALQAEAFDALTLLGRALRPSEDPSAARAALLERLVAPHSLEGVTGTLALQDGRIAPRVHLRTLDGTRIRARLSESEERALRSGAPLRETPPLTPLGPVR
jgi:branched-chain amino acid transport system substrate-binding protein